MQRDQTIPNAISVEFPANPKISSEAKVRAGRCCCCCCCCCCCTGLQPITSRRTRVMDGSYFSSWCVCLSCLMTDLLSVCLSSVCLWLVCTCSFLPPAGFHSALSHPQPAVPSRSSGPGWRPVSQAEELKQNQLYITELNFMNTIQATANSRLQQIGYSTHMDHFMMVRAFQKAAPPQARQRAP
jgi:hypothetical protein